MNSERKLRTFAAGQRLPISLTQEIELLLQRSEHISCRHKLVRSVVFDDAV